MKVSSFFTRWSYLLPITITCSHKTKRRNIEFNRSAFYANFVILASMLIFILLSFKSKNEIFQNNILRILSQLKYAIHGLIFSSLPKQHPFLWKFLKGINELYLNSNTTFKTGHLLLIKACEYTAAIGPGIYLCLIYCVNFINVYAKLDLISSIFFFFNCYYLYLDICIFHFYSSILIMNMVTFRFILFKIKEFFVNGNGCLQLYCQMWKYYVKHLKSFSDHYSLGLGTYFILEISELILRFGIISICFINNNSYFKIDKLGIFYTACRMVVIYSLLAVYDRIEKIVSGLIQLIQFIYKILLIFNVVKLILLFLNFFYCGVMFQSYDTISFIHRQKLAFYNLDELQNLVSILHSCRPKLTGHFGFEFNINFLLTVSS